MNDSIETHCPICREEYDDVNRPSVQLHDTGTARNHTSCELCFNKWVKQKSTCPICKAHIDSSIEERHSSHTDDELTRAKQVVPVLTKKKCSYCDDEAKIRCENCRLYFCQDCKIAHGKNKSFRNHNVQEMTSLSSSDIDDFPEVTICDIEGHGYPKDMYCTECEIPCCRQCVEHEKHGVKRLASVLKEKADRAKQEGNYVIGRKADIEKQVQALERRLEHVANMTTMEEDAIRSAVRAIIQSAETQEKMLIDDLQTHNRELVMTLETEIRRRKGLLEEMSPIENFLREEKPMGDIAALKLYKTILKCSSDMSEISLTDCEMQTEAARFVQTTQVDWARYKIGYIHSAVPEEDKVSLKGNPGLSSLENEIRMLIIGKKNSGRTRTSFALMEQETKPSSRLFVKSLKNKTFRLRRSPGIGPNREIDKERDDIIQNLSPGPHVVLLSIKNPDDDVAYVDDYVDIFREDLMKHLILIFTGKKDLDKKKISLDKYVSSLKDGSLARILRVPGVRYVAVNLDNKDSLDSFRDAVFKMACDVIDANGLRYLSVR